MAWSVGACAQERALPTKAMGGADTAVDTWTDGTTGKPDSGEANMPSVRLPLAGKPAYTTFAGAGGDESLGEAGASVSVGGAHASSEGVDISTFAGLGPVDQTPEAAAGTAGTDLGGSAGAGGTSLEIPALLFSEYVEGSGGFKALEIYALRGTSLEGCELQTYFNGKREPARLALHGTLARGEVQVLCSSALAAAQRGTCQRSTNLTFNGDDALALTCSGTVLDVIGQIGSDPGESWAAGATVDHTLRRRCGIGVGRSDGTRPFEVTAEWLTLATDTFSGLGRHDCGVP